MANPHAKPCKAAQLQCRKAMKKNETDYQQSEPMKTFTCPKPRSRHPTPCCKTLQHPTGEDLLAIYKLHMPMSSNLPRFPLPKEYGKNDCKTIEPESALQFHCVLRPLPKSIYMQLQLQHSTKPDMYDSRLVLDFVFSVLQYFNRTCHPKNPRFDRSRFRIT